jgi:hypothetical protein
MFTSTLCIIKGRKTEKAAGSSQRKSSRVFCSSCLVRLCCFLTIVDPNTDAISNYMAHLLHFRLEILMTGSLEALLQISEEAGKAKLGSQISPDKLQMSEEAEAEVEPAIETSKQADGA